jgi:uncharacterized protein (TIGR03435 family)
MRAILLFTLLFSDAFGVQAQTVDSSPKFEVAAIRPSPPRTSVQSARGCNGGPGTSNPGRWTCNESLSNLIRSAYQLKGYQFTFPDWMVIDSFEIEATIPAGTAKEQMPLMIRNLLAERFKLAAHLDKKEMQIYDMTAGKDGPKFKEWVDEPPLADADRPRPGVGPRSVDIRIPSNADAVLSFGAEGRKARKSKETMDAFAAWLSSSLDRPVIDATGLTGTYKIMLDYVMEQQYAPGRGPADPPPLAAGPTLLKAVESQLGLDLKSKKGMIDVLVIDHIEKTPTEN